MVQANPMKKAVAKVVLLGDMSVGKTTLINKFATGNAGNASATIGTDFKTKQLTVNNTNLTMQIWDTAGQERYQSLGTAFYRGADCAFLVYDITNTWSFDNIPNWKNSFLQKSMVSMPETFPFMVVGNKLDLAEDQRAVERTQAEEFCKREGMELIETSARDNLNVEDAFALLA